MPTFLLLFSSLEGFLYISSSRSSPRNFFSSILAPTGGPLWNSLGAKAFKSFIAPPLRTREKMTYAVTMSCKFVLSSGRLGEAHTASSVSLCTAGDVQAKSGVTKKPVRRAAQPVTLLTIHVRLRGVRGYTPTSSPEICHCAPGTCTCRTEGFLLQTHSVLEIFWNSLSSGKVHPCSVTRRPLYKDLLRSTVSVSLMGMPVTSGVKDGMCAVV